MSLLYYNAVNREKGSGHSYFGALKPVDSISLLWKDTVSAMARWNP